MASFRFILIAGVLLLNACDAPTQSSGAAPVVTTGEPAPSGLSTETVTIGSETFTIELAHEPEDILLGMGGRRSIEPRGGMLFIFDSPAYRQFLMRDCYVPIDIAFLDSRGVVLSLYTMPIETPQAENESDDAYERRLPKYASRYRTLFVLETAAGTWDAQGVQVGGQIGFDAEKLKKLAF